MPATDDEVMEVEDFLEYDQIEMGVDIDTGHSEGCASIERSSSGKLLVECSEGVCFFLSSTKCYILTPETFQT